MALRLARDGCADSRYERIVRRGAAERLAQIRRILLAETHIQGASAGDADPIAAFTEIVGERRDEPDAASGFPDIAIARRAAGGVSRRGKGQVVFKSGAQLG